MYSFKLVGKDTDCFRNIKGIVISGYGDLLFEVPAVELPDLVRLSDYLYVSRK